MPSRFAAYLALLRLVDDASRHLGLSHLTAADKHVLLVLTHFADKDGLASGFTYTVYCESAQDDWVVSRAQFFKSLDRLLKSKLVRKTGTGRAPHYLLCY